MRLAAISCLALLAAAAPAFAAVDDEVAPASPVAAPAGLVAAARQLVDDTVETAQRMVTATWRLALGTPYAPRGHTMPRGAADDPPPPEAPDLSLGARWRVLHGDANAHVPFAAWMPDLQAADARLGALRPTLSLSGEWALPNDFSLGVMPGVAMDYASGRLQATGTFAVTLGRSWSPQWRTFVDMTRDRLAVAQPAGASTSVDAGISFVASPTTRVDFALTHGLGDTAPPFQAGVGLSSTF